MTSPNASHTSNDLGEKIVLHNHFQKNISGFNFIPLKNKDLREWKAKNDGKKRRISQEPKFVGGGHTWEGEETGVRGPLKMRGA